MKKAILVLALLTSYGTEAMAQALLAGPHDLRLSLLARYDDSKPDKLRFAYPGSGFVVRYTGAAPLLDLSSDTETAAVTLVPDEGSAVLALLYAGRQSVATPTPEQAFASRPHTLAIYKRTETWQGVISFFGVLSGGTTALLTAPTLPVRRLLFVGDSVTCGAGAVLRPFIFVPRSSTAQRLST